MGTQHVRVAVLVGGHGRGTNLQAILDGCVSGEIAGEVAVVVGTRSDAPAMERARAGGVPAVTVSPRQYEQDEEAYGEHLLRVFGRHGVDLVCLAGYMRILPRGVVRAYAGRVMNTHPALLPLFGGKGMYGERVHRAALESGMKVSGCTVHFADENYDSGPIILQTAVAILEEDTWETLAARILPEEHRAYRRAIRLFGEGRLAIEGRRVRISGGADASAADPPTH